MTNRIYVYTMTSDSGIAPSVTDGQLTLACCKPKIRKKVGELMSANNQNGSNQDDGDSSIWVIGLLGSDLLKRNVPSFKKIKGKGLSSIGKMVRYAPIYIAKIDKAISLIDYYDEKNRKVYGAQKDWNMYNVKNGKLSSTKANPHRKSKKDKAKDKKGSVLVSSCFYYFGESILNLLDPDLMPNDVHKDDDARKLIGHIANDNELDSFFKKAKGCGGHQGSTLYSDKSRKITSPEHCKFVDTTLFEKLEKLLKNHGSNGYNHKCFDKNDTCSGSKCVSSRKRSCSKC